MCDSPNLAYYTGRLTKTGKREIKFVPRRVDLSYEAAKSHYGKDLLLLPCGHCPSCLKQYAFDWSVRLMAESLYHEKMCFLTLTYDDRHLPKFDGEKNPLQKKDLQDFFKRLRKHFNDVKLMYFACGEHGSNGTQRPHYHAIVFGIDFDDKKLISINKLNQSLWSSKTLDSIWKNGFASIGDVSPQSCGYVARYSMKKKLTGRKVDEFLLMSRRPAIGQRFFDDHKFSIYETDRIYNKKFVSSKVPRFFDKRADESDIEVRKLFIAAKTDRYIKAKGHEFFNLIHFGVDSVEQAQRRLLEQGLKNTEPLRRSL